MISKDLRRVSERQTKVTIRTNSQLAHHGNPGSRRILPRYRQVDGTSPCQSVNTTKRSQLARDETRRRELLVRRLGLQKPWIDTKNLEYKSVRAELNHEEIIGLAYGSPWQPLYGMDDR